MKIDGSALQATIQKITGALNEKKMDTGKMIQDAVGIMEEAEKLREKNLKSHESKIGLVYGKVQSGKTNAMIASTALAFDNGYKVAIILTSNNKTLVSQTRDRFAEKVAYPDGVVETYIYQDIQNESVFSFEQLAHPTVKIVIITGKGSKALTTVTDFLEKFASTEKAIIFDDEGDNYSLDNNRNDRDEEEDLPPTRINELIFTRLRNKIDHVLISVTGTPQGVLLEGTNQPLGFKYLLEPSPAYAGGEIFFDEEVPEENPLIDIFNTDESECIEKTGKIGEGLQRAIMDFYVAATLYHADTGRHAEFLCHPHQTIARHERYRDVLKDYHNYVVDLFWKDDVGLMSEFRRLFEQRKLKHGRIQYFDQFKKSLGSQIMKTRILLINAGQKDEMAPEKHHILIGGNILGRGVTIDNMLVMYYARNAKTTNMDTLYQHARMFGYRREMLEYMRIYMPAEIYAKFHATYEMDESLRALVKKHPYDTFPITYFDGHTGLRLVRSQIESKSFLETVFIPRRQFYPNHVSDVLHEKNAVHYETLATEIKALDGQLVTLEVLRSILTRIETSSTNQWKGQQPINILKGLLEGEVDPRIHVSTSISERRSWRKGAIGTGTLDGERVEEMRKGEHISICFSSFAYKNRPDLGKIWYPTIVFPERLDGVGKVYITK